MVCVDNSKFKTIKENGKLDTYPKPATIQNPNPGGMKARGGHIKKRTLYQSSTVGGNLCAKERPMSLWLLKSVVDADELYTPVKIKYGFALEVNKLIFVIQKCKVTFLLLVRAKQINKKSTPRRFWVWVL